MSIIAAVITITQTMLMTAPGKKHIGHLVITLAVSDQRYRIEWEKKRARCRERNWKRVERGICTGGFCQEHDRRNHHYNNDRIDRQHQVNDHCECADQNQNPERSDVLNFRREPNRRAIGPGHWPMTLLPVWLHRLT